MCFTCGWDKFSSFSVGSFELRIKRNIRFYVIITVFFNGWLSMFNAELFVFQKSWEGAN